MLKEPKYILHDWKFYREEQLFCRYNSSSPLREIGCLEYNWRQKIAFSLVFCPN